MLLLGTVAVPIAWSEELPGSAISHTVTSCVSGVARLQPSDDGPMVLTATPCGSATSATDTGRTPKGCGFSAGEVTVTYTISDDS